MISASRSLLGHRAFVALRRLPPSPHCPLHQGLGGSLLDSVRRASSKITMGPLTTCPSCLSLSRREFSSFLNASYPFARKNSKALNQRYYQELSQGEDHRSALSMDLALLAEEDFELELEGGGRGSGINDLYMTSSYEISDLHDPDLHITSQEPEFLEDFEDHDVPHLLPGPQQQVSLPLPKGDPPIRTSTAPASKKKKKSPSKNLKKHEREQTAKFNGGEMERLGREVSFNNSLVAFLEMCVFTGQINRGLNTLNYYRTRGMGVGVGGSGGSNNSETFTYPRVRDVRAYNIILRGFASKGNTNKVREIFRLLNEDGIQPNAQSYSSLISCLGRNPASKNNLHSIRQSLTWAETAGFSLNDLFNKTILEGDERDILLQSIRRVRPSFTPVVVPPSPDYSCPLLTHLNQCEGGGDRGVVTPDLPGIGIIPWHRPESATLKNLREKAKIQLDMERKGTLTVKSIEEKIGKQETLDYFRTVAMETEKRWESWIKEAFERNLVTLLNNQGVSRYKGARGITLHPFLKALPMSDITKIIIQEIRKLCEGSEIYSPGVGQLYRELGQKVLSRYEVLHKDETGVLQKVTELYDEYIQWYLSYDTERQINPRQKWQSLLYSQDYEGPHVDIGEKAWPNSVLSSVGRFLYGIIMRDIKIDANIMKINSNKQEQLVPAFYSIFRMQGMHLKEEIKPHPVLVKLFHAASRDELTFDSTLVPMLAPPLPWSSIRTGGYLLSPAKIVRLPYSAHQQKVRLEASPPEDLYPSLDSLNQLGAVPWKINQRVLDLVISVFNSNGDESLSISPPPSTCPPPPPITAEMSKLEKIKAHKERAALRRRKGEMYSLWCDALYRLSLANHFREDTFWFPHNMDFRGRVYPCPPHLNHLGADMSRAILVFAKGRPLGEKGLDWLMLHLVNLTGLKKKDGIEERLAFARSLLPDILDSADDPQKGRRWWATSEEPWQTLACCIEIANAIRSGDPASYISHFPVHQDGSCNGLQHYAALGRDSAGAMSVNLAVSEKPQDVYSAVANLVEKMRQEDAENGVQIAQVLEGFIRRKVIKQTVMTTVYGVTRYGARLQIARQLKDIPDFPKDFVWPASTYLVAKTFDSLQEMFTSAKLIQDWFTDCARQISQVCQQNVEWVTPLGLPVVQPYIRVPKKVTDGYDPLRIQETHIFDLYERPNVMKQKNAFPPNFIHSLDSSHMMLTSLHCEKEGITFVSVHDCYWTHPATVEIMNRVCREQFVALHSQPILEDLSAFLYSKYSYSQSDITPGGNSIVDSSKLRLNSVLTAVPPKGDFNLRNVLKSVFFFS